MILPLSLFLIGLLGFILNRKYILSILLSLELILLAVTVIALIGSLNLDVAIGQTVGVFIIAIAGAESAIGLSIIVVYYRLRDSISVTHTLYLTLILLPFIGSIFAGLRGRSLGFYGAGLITTGCITLSAIIA